MSDKRDIPEPDGTQGPQLVAQPRSAIHQVAPRPAWAGGVANMKGFHERAADPTFLANVGDDPVRALREWGETEARDHGLVDIKFFPRIPGDPPPNLEKAAAEVLRVLTTPGEDVSDQEL